MLTVKQAAERAGVSFGLVYEWTRSGMLPHYRMGRSGARGGIRIADVDLDAFLQSRHRGTGKRSGPCAAPEAQTAPSPDAFLRVSRRWLSAALKCW